MFEKSLEKDTEVSISFRTYKETKTDWLVGEISDAGIEASLYVDFCHFFFVRTFAHF